jgi:hypothetical protein
MANSLVAHIIKKGRHYHLHLENLTDDTLTEVEVLSFDVENYDDCPMMRISFERLPELPGRTTTKIKHQVYIDKNGKWAAAGDKDWFTNDMLMCLTEELSHKASYALDVSWFVNGKADNQTLPAGAGSGLSATR